jgi:catechol-2,3-dioxygenase
MKQVATYLNFDGNCRKAMQFYQKCLDTDIDHIDLRVPRLAEVVAFYEAQLPALGFSRRMVYPMVYPIFFEDPTGNRLEVCHRLRA